MKHDIPRGKKRESNLKFIKNSRVYQEAKEEGVMQSKLEMIPILSGLGLTVEQIAEQLKLDVKTVRNNTQQ